MCVVKCMLYVCVCMRVCAHTHMYNLQCYSSGVAYLSLRQSLTSSELPGVV